MHPTEPVVETDVDNLVATVGGTVRNDDVTTRAIVFASLRVIVVVKFNANIDVGQTCSGVLRGDGWTRLKDAIKELR